MRKNRRITVSLSVTRNLGNFNSLKPQVDYGFDLEDGASLDEALAEAWGVVEDSISEKIQEALAE